MKITISILAAIASFVSAILWFWSAALKPAYPMAYASGPPKEIVGRMNFQARLNGFAAGLTGLSALLQSVALFLPD